LADARKAVWLVNWKAWDLPYCSLYVVSTDSKWPCKIGISIDPYKRIGGIQTGVWRRVDVHKCFYLKTVKQARALEQKIHQTLTDQGKWLHGEWFDLRPEQTTDIIEFEAMVLGLEINSEIEDDEIANSLYNDMWEATRHLKYQMIENREGFDEHRL
jgi:hypothetical protein